MPKKKTELESNAGKLISAIQKEWANEAGCPIADESEEIMYKAHDLLIGVKNNNIYDLLDGMNVTQFLGDFWVHKHPRVKKHIEELENSLKKIWNIN